MILSNENHLPPAVAPDVITTLVEMLDIDDAKILIELIDAFLDDASAMLGNMETEWATGNEKGLLLIAHSLKSTSATFRAERLHGLMEELELALRSEQIDLNIPQHIVQTQQEFERVARALQQERQKLVAHL